MRRRKGEKMSKLELSEGKLLLHGRVVATLANLPYIVECEVAEALSCEDEIDAARMEGYEEGHCDAIWEVATDDPDALRDLEISRSIHADPELEKRLLAMGDEETKAPRP
jgi:hypothetical protein